MPVFIKNKGENMKEIKDYTKEMAELADENVKGFNHTFLCFKTIFNIMNSHGVFAKAFGEVTNYEIDYIEQFELETFKYGVVEEYDGKIYPAVDMIIGFTDISTRYKTNFCLTVTPFNAYLDDEHKTSGMFGGCDWNLSKIWRVVMKGFYADRWVEAFNNYCADVETMHDCDLNTRDGFENIEKKLKQDNGLGTV